MNTSTKLREDDLPQLAGQAVQRAQQARRQMTELSLEETDQVGGALSVMGPLLQQPKMIIRPGDWAGPLLAQQFQNPVVNVAVRGM